MATCTNDASNYLTQNKYLASATAENGFLSRLNTAGSEFLAEPFKGEVSAKDAALVKSNSNFSGAEEPLDNEEDFMENFLSAP